MGVSDFRIRAFDVKNDGTVFCAITCAEALMITRSKYKCCMFLNVSHCFMFLLFLDVLGVLLLRVLIMSFALLSYCSCPRSDQRFLCGLATCRHRS